jgi:pyruvate kinase
MRTKLVVTIGPASQSKEVLKKFVYKGMDIARMNFSHCTEDEYKERVRVIRGAEKKYKKKVLILQDLQGPRIRIGYVAEEGIILKKGQQVIFSTKKDDPKTIFIDYTKLHKEILPGHTIYLANGDMELVTKRVAGNRIFATVVRGGKLFSRKGVNLPDTKLSNSGLTAQDIKHLKFGLAQGVDIVAISFVQSGDDMKRLKKIVQGRAKVMAKIETAIALQNIDGIMRESDYVMVARGDLAIEVGLEKMPYIQKNLIRHANWLGKGVVTATQMLMSMMDRPTPTRADVSDIANAVFDGTDALMLSDESAAGNYPVEAIETMAKIAEEAEKATDMRHNPFNA